MFYRVTQYQFPEGREGDIAAWADTKTELVRGIEGLIAVDVFNASPGVGRSVLDHAIGEIGDDVVVAGR